VPSKNGFRFALSSTGSSSSSKPNEDEDENEGEEDYIITMVLGDDREVARGNGSGGGDAP